MVELNGYLVYALYWSIMFDSFYDHKVFFDLFSEV
jgi:hypothetical protein